MIILTRIVVVLLATCAVVQIASADTFGTGANQFSIDFVTIGNAGNPGDARAEASPTGCGAVGYEYRIGQYEVTNAQWNTFTLAAGSPIGNPSNAYDEIAYWTGTQQPTNEVSWYEAAQFCNYLTSGDKSQGAYLFSGDNANPGDFNGIDRASAILDYGTVYVIPKEDEWYKAAYYTGSGYSTYANGTDAIPAADNGWNYIGSSYGTPWDVGTGTMEQNGTYDMMGNLWEWNETLIGSALGVRGGSYGDGDHIMGSSYRNFSNYPDFESNVIVFRVASISISIPKPSLSIRSAVMLEPQDMQADQNYYILSSSDLTNWSFLRGKVTTLGTNVYVETGGDSVVIVDGADSQTSIFINTEHQQRQFYKITQFPPEGMVLVLAGEFEMGRHVGSGESDELPLHDIYVSSFYMDQYEVTNQQYCDYLNDAYSRNLIEVRGDGVDTGDVYAVGGIDIYFRTNEQLPDSRIYWNGSTFIVASGKEDHPIAFVSWYGANAYAQFYGKRLPTEAEWEYAARGGLRYYKYPWGNDISDTQANYSGSSDPYESGSWPWTTPVGYYSPNGYGLYDVAGNLWEWCSDWYSSTYYASSPYYNPQGPGSGSNCVLRGGNWSDYVINLRCADRLSRNPNITEDNFGFRCAKDAQ